VLTQRRVQVADGVFLAVRDRSPDTPNRRPVVLVHGLASTSRLWDGVAQHLAASSRRSLSVDLRGHGDSDAPGVGYDTSTAAQDIVALLPQVSDEAVTLAGQSWGGNVALEVAARRPDLVAGLALVDGGWISLSARFGSWEEAAGVLAPAVIDGLTWTDFQAMVSSSMAGFPAGAVDAATSVVRVLDDGTIRRRLTIQRHMQILRSLWDHDPAALYRHISCPTVLMPATTGGTLPDDVAEALDALPDARLRAYPGAHHDVHLQRPAEVADDIGSLP
jgi:pimeloyl-ACP methyl ester carboxylesterase